jgi:hypothetical protein
MPNSSAESAMQRESGDGATGGIVAINSEWGEFKYIVTAKHVIAKGATVVRLNATDRILDFKVDDWFMVPSGPDLAISALPDEANDDSVIAIESVLFYSQNRINKRLNIGIGDDVFMMGRHHPAEHAGIEDPVVRFGNISVWPSRGILHSKTGLPQQSFLVEMRSQSGYSGSPVFVTIDGGTARLKPEPYNPTARSFESLDDPWVAFLGIDWGHLPEHGSTLMALVIPDSEVWDMLNSDELKRQRKAMGDERFKRLEKSTGPDYEGSP